MNQKRQTVKCPKHNVELVPQETKYGTRWACPTEDCTMVAWQAYGTFRDKPISAPADYETRQARIAAHTAFDKLWKSGRLKRSRVYKQLAKYMGLSTRETHISHFDLVQCKKVIDFTNQKGESNVRINAL